MRMNDFVTRARIEDVAHSSGYAKAQSGKNFGAASSQTFSQRMSVDRQKARIKAYEHSKVARQNFSSRGRVNEISNSSLEKIRETRALRQNFLRDSDQDLRRRAGSEISRPSFQSKRDFSQIRQSGIAGFSSSEATVSSPNSAGFHQIRPQIDR